MRTLKLEEVYLKDYRHFEEAEQNIGQFIEEVYNEKRLHSSLGHLPGVDARGATRPEGRKLTTVAVRKNGFRPNPAQTTCRDREEMRINFMFFSETKRTTGALVHAFGLAIITPLFGLQGTNHAHARGGI